MKQAERVRQKIKTGEQSEVQGLLEQWLREGRVTETEALLSATDMFTAGVDSVNNIIVALRRGNVLTIKFLFYTH